MKKNKEKTVGLRIDEELLAKIDAVLAADQSRSAKIREILREYFSKKKKAEK